MTLVKQKDPNRKKRSITWDENAITEQDKERGTRMKIPEISTPFNYDAWECSSEEDHTSHTNQINHEHLTEVTNRLNEIQEEIERKKMFKEHRKQHYDEFKTVKALKKGGKLSDESDD